MPSQFDTIGVEAALRIKDKIPDAIITVLSLGPDSFRDTIKHCLAMGADEGVHINDPAVNDADHWVTAEVLAAAIQKLGAFDLVIAGRQAVDWDMGVVGSTIAEILGVPGRHDRQGDRVRRRQGHRRARAARRLRDGRSADAGRRHRQQRARRAALPAAPPDHAGGEEGSEELDAGRPRHLGAAAARVNLEALFVPDTSVETEFIDGETPQEKAQKLAQRLREAKLI